MKAMSLRLDDDQAAALELVAKADGRTLSDTVRDAIDAHIEQRRKDAAFKKRLGEIVARERAVLDRLAL